MNTEPSEILRSDTGLWRLSVYIGERGVQAWLTLRDNPSVSPRLLLNEVWSPSREDLLTRISNAIYDNPDVLEDYSASIVVESSRNLMVPSRLINEPGDAADIYNKVYRSQPEDVMSDDSSPFETALYTLTPGLLGFLRRTFPGARLHSHLNQLKHFLRLRGTGMRIFLSQRPGMADILVFNGENLLSAASQPWREWTDLVYRIANVAGVYHLPLPDTEIFLDGQKEEMDQVSAFFESKCRKVRRIDRAGSPEKMPLALALANL